MASAGMVGHTIEELAGHLRTGIFSPVYLLAGDEEFLIEESRKAIVGLAVNEQARSFNHDVLDGEDTDVPTVLARVSAYPMMADRRVVVLRDVDRLANKDALLPYFQKPLPSTVLILTAIKADFRQNFFKSVGATAYVVGCKQLFENQIPPWIQQRVSAAGGKITADACQLLVDRAGRSLRMIQQEIDKVLISAGDRRDITADDVHAVVGLSKQFNIYELQRTIGKKSFPASITILENMLIAGEKPVDMIPALCRYFQKIWKYGDLVAKKIPRNQIAEILGVKPYFLAEYAEAASHFPGREIEAVFHALLLADENLKTSGGDPRLVMTMMLHSIMRPGDAK